MYLKGLRTHSTLTADPLKSHEEEKRENTHFPGNNPSKPLEFGITFNSCHRKKVRHRAHLCK
jgi:hypothetical protein